MLGRQANAGVGHLETQFVLGIRAVLRAHAQPHRALGSELHGVVQVVEQHLGQPLGVTHVVQWQVHRHVDHVLQPLALRLRQDQRGHVVQQRVQPEAHMLQRQSARLDLAEIQDVVDDVQQVLAGSLDLPQVVLLADGVRG